MTRVQTTIDILRGQREFMIQELNKLDKAIEILGEVSASPIVTTKQRVDADRDVARAMVTSKERTQRAVRKAKARRNRSRSASSQLNQDMLAFIRAQTMDGQEYAVPMTTICEHLYKEFSKDTENLSQFTKSISARMAGLVQTYPNLNRYRKEDEKGFEKYYYWWA